MKRVYIFPEFSEIKIEDIIAASTLKVLDEGDGESVDYNELA